MELKPQHAKAVLDFWFGDQVPPTKEHQQRWFSGGEQTDREIHQRFGELHTQLRSQPLPEAWLNDPESRLAAILVIDQFSRNLFRGKADAFAWDDRACQWAISGWEQQAFHALPSCHQAFSLMPLMHSEKLALHSLAADYFADLIGRFPSDKTLTGFQSSAEEHRAIIERFGRYPHRNAVLGRPNSPEESRYLEKGARRFGQ